LTSSCKELRQQARRCTLHEALSLAGVVALGSVAALACAAVLREVPRGPHPLNGGTIPIVVDRAPPPAQLEVIEPATDSDCYWADGSWKFQDNQWVWEAGGWVRLESDCYYAEGSLVWVPAVNQPGALFFTPGQWYHESSGQPCTAPAACATAPSPAP
jgi:hypothetical protein